MNVYKYEHYKYELFTNIYKIFIRKIKENEVGKDIAFQKMIQHADRLSNK